MPQRSAEHSSKDTWRNLNFAGILAIARDLASLQICRNGCVLESAHQGVPKNWLLLLHFECTFLTKSIHFMSMTLSNNLKKHFTQIHSIFYFYRGGEWSNLPIFTFLTIFTPHKNENGMDIGEMLLNVITSYQGDEKKSGWEEKST